MNSEQKRMLESGKFNVKDLIKEGVDLEEAMDVTPTEFIGPLVRELRKQGKIKTFTAEEIRKKPV